MKLQTNMYALTLKMITRALHELSYQLFILLRHTVIDFHHIPITKKFSRHPVPYVYHTDTSIRKQNNVSIHLYILKKKGKIRGEPMRKQMQYTKKNLFGQQQPCKRRLRLPLVGKNKCSQFKIYTILCHKTRLMIGALKNFQ